MLTKDQQTERYCFVVRHGERADLARKHQQIIRNEVDPPLTELGLEQAVETGLFLRKYLQEVEKEIGKKFDSVILESSPFIRSMATAAQIAKPLGINKVKINYRFSERQAHGQFQESPIEQLEYNKKSVSILNDEFSLLDVDFDDTEDYKEEATEYLFPESSLQCKNRISNGISKFHRLLF